VAIELGIFQPSKIEWENEIPAAQAGSKPRRAYAHKKMGFEPIGATDPALGSYSRRLTGSAARTEKMDWHQIEKNWKEAKRKIKEKWGKLSEGDLDAIDGRRNRLEDRISKRYGFAEDHIRKEIDDWLRWQTLKSPAPSTAPSGLSKLRP
jgi:uncharacterized protein YjbJ (UPF0337 family)